ncbi:MAG: polysulfide reductase NrfD [Thermodesulfovibrionales bacterium]|nr:polysulfide reductase NrfD [Thermodesulfovibrionales bacterium]
MAENLTKTEAATEVAVPTRWDILVNRLTGLSKTYYLLLGLCSFIAMIGIAAGLHAMYIGYNHAYNVSREIPWGILISTYVFFVVTSTGLCLVSSIGHVFGVKDFMPIAKRAVFLSIVTIVAGFTVIFFEIENPFRMAIYNIISPNFYSNIWWMGTLYGAYLFFMILEFILLQIEKHKLASYAGFMGVVSGIAAHSNLGAVFGMLHGREFWYGPYMPIYFIASAMMSGCATILFFTYMAHKINNEHIDKMVAKALEVTTRVGILTICIIMFFTIWKVLTGFVGAEGKREALMVLLAGKYSFNFWFLEVGIGMLIPLILYILSKGKNMKLIFIGSALMIFGIFFMRYDLVVVGQIVPVYYELGVAEYETLLSYSPSIHEILVVLGGLGIVATTFLLGEKIFNAHRVEEHEHVPVSISFETMGMADTKILKE